MSQLELFNPSPASDDFTPDDYETPDRIARSMANLVIPTDKFILEPFAGTGQIAKFLPSDRDVTCNEIKRSRFNQGANSVTNGKWFNEDYFTSSSLLDNHYDLIISNPPFSLCLEAIERSLLLLNSANTEARIIFLMPLDWNCSMARAAIWRQLNTHISHVYRIPERIDYLMNGTPCSRTQKVKDGIPIFKPSGKPSRMSGRQCYDAVFEIRPGRENPATSYLP